MAKPKLRIAHLVSHPIQYFVPLYRELASREEIELTVYFYSDATLQEFQDPGFGQRIRWDTAMLGGYNAKILPSAIGRSIGGGLQRPNLDIVRDIARERYDAVWLHGYAHTNTWLVAALALARGIQLLIRDEQTLLDGRPLHKRLLKAALLRALFKRSHSLYIGENNRRYFKHYGMADGKQFPARYCVDNDFFREKEQELRPLRAELRARLGITDDAPVILFCGKFIGKKQPLYLLEAFARLRAEVPCWLLMVGDGPLAPAAKDLVRNLGIKNVIMPGFLNQSELPNAYTAADIFVLPSSFQETWGLVVNEAMNFSLPVVVTDKVGCSPDLVRDDWNGFVVDHADAAALASALRHLVVDERLRREFGCRSYDIVSDYSIQSCANEIVGAMRAVTKHIPPPHL
jgi:glycosyltransferase involved in cell wall biosynthesis